MSSSSNPLLAMIKEGSANGIAAKRAARRKAKPATTSKPEFVKTPDDGSLPSTMTASEGLKFMNECFAWIESLGCVATLQTEQLEYRPVGPFRITWNNRSVRFERFVQVDDGGGNARSEKQTSYAPLAKYWLEHAHRRTYQRVGMWAPPKQAPKDAYNLWRGFAVKDTPGDWSLMRAHIRDVIADGDDKLDEYIIRWIAWMFQNPGERAEAALVLQGDEGTGKGMLANTLMEIIGKAHAWHGTDPDHFIGKFNTHLAGCVFLFADESYYAGDRSVDGKIKALITEPTIPIEPKNVNKYAVENTLHILISSNNDWVVPAGSNARRYTVAKVSESRMQDRDYFKAIRREIENGGREAMLYDLLHMDLGDWHPRNIVDTKALQDQKERSLSPEGEWTLGIVSTGELPTDMNGMGGKREGYRIVNRVLKEHAMSALPRGNWSRARIEDAVKSIGATRFRTPTERGWKFPTLAEAREHWCKSYYRRDWDDADDWA